MDTGSQRSKNGAGCCFGGWGYIPLLPGARAPDTGAFLRLSEQGANRGFRVLVVQKRVSRALLKTSFFLCAFDGFFVWRIWRKCYQTMTLYDRYDHRATGDIDKDTPIYLCIMHMGVSIAM